MKRTFKFLVVGAVAITIAGCASRRLATQGNRQYVPPPPPQPVYPPPGTIIVPQGSVPSANLPQGSFQQGSVPPGGPAPGYYSAPPNSPPLPGAGGTQPFPTSPPPGPASQFPVAPPNAPPAAANVPNAAPDRVGYRWEPSAPQGAPQGAPPSVPPLVAPTPSPPAGPPTVLLLPPTPEPSTAEPPKQEPQRQLSPSEQQKDPQRQLYPPEQQKEPPTAPLPVGIAGFDRPRDGVATGQRPSLEGLDWLQKSNYRNVAFLHLPGEAIDADRQQVERRGMTFVPIEINPRELNREAVERFLRLQTQSAAEKLFVYDLDGSLTGAMWYLSYRLVDLDSDEVASIKAASLGLGENRDPARDVWRAVRKYLEQK